ncbi:5'(3')-deoxyribonucleotidase [Mariprofundus ferrinatatus]|uniref:5'(3')-deoxyribonucleotidase n=1 Tax=Mariprofundus ferrinatatus TaxID=1921087 RepID=A0A2K8L643_9PROT|nr:hypothetical protein [Mariprofundus ferrinatatus]ATX81719.1 5'(3')-deoxyribonucleotidase [Mariprofundus ferrinatatus]
MTKQNGSDAKKKVLFIDMDNVLVDFQSGINQLNEEQLKEYEGRYDEVPGIFSTMKPKEGALEAFRLLARKFDAYILSTAPWENPSAWSDKLEWVKKYLGDPAYKRLILSHHKNLSEGDYLIDDRTANGADRFTGEHIHFGTEKFTNWYSVLHYLTKKEGYIGILQAPPDHPIYTRGYIIGGMCSTGLPKASASKNGDSDSSNIEESES